MKQSDHRNQKPVNPDRAGIKEKERKNRSRQLGKFEEIIRIKFKDKSILNKSLTHRSVVNEYGSNIKDNERLEHLGDSVLGFIISDYLYKNFTEYPEGNLAKIKSVIVSDETLAREAKGLNIGSFILMGKGEELSGGRNRISMLANTMESVIGAIYLDSGLKVCKKFVLSLLKNDIEQIRNIRNIVDPKTALQEYVQKKYKESPFYEVVEESGPAHKKIFLVRLMIKSREISTGRGGSKRKAEMHAAAEAMKLINSGANDI